MPEIRRKNNPVWPGQNELSDLKRWVEKMQGLRNSACKAETHQKHGKDPLPWQKHLPECQEVIRILPHESWAKTLWILACNSTHSRGSKGDDSRWVEESLVKNLQGHILHYSPHLRVILNHARQPRHRKQEWRTKIGHLFISGSIMSPFTTKKTKLWHIIQPGRCQRSPPVPPWWRSAGATTRASTVLSPIIRLERGTEKSMAGWKITCNWRFIAGRFIYKWWITRGYSSASLIGFNQHLWFVRIRCPLVSLPKNHQFYVSGTNPEGNKWLVNGWEVSTFTHHSPTSRIIQVGDLCWFMLHQEAVTHGMYIHTMHKTTRWNESLKW